MKKSSLYTIFVFSDEAKKVKKFQLSRKFLKIGLSSILLLCFLAVILGILYMHSIQKLGKFNVMQAQLQKERLEFKKLKGKIDELEEDLNRTRQFEAKLRIMTNQEHDLENQGQLLGIGGQVPDNILDVESELLFDTLGTKIDDLMEESNATQVSLSSLYENLQDKQALLAATPSIWPTNGWVTSNFGNRINPFTGKKKMHRGIDIANRIGASVFSPADGIVTFTGVEGSYGKIIKIDHGYGMSSIYGHLSEILVKVGQHIDRGDKIAAVGNTGKSTAPHLHYEVRLSGVPVNPRQYILD